MKICEEEIDETLYWLELIKHPQIFDESRMQPLIAEADELCAIITAICKTTSAKLRNRKSQIVNPKCLYPSQSWSVA